jgi:flagellar L-ring protein precursor FlgH
MRVAERTIRGASMRFTESAPDPHRAENAPYRRRPAGAMLRASRTALCRVAACGAALALLAGCVPNPPLPMHQPVAVRPQPAAAPQPADGAIFREVSVTRAAYTPLFEDIRARAVGDILTIQINEKIAASKQSGSRVAKDSSLEANGPSIKTPTRVLVKPIEVSANSGTKFEGRGDQSNSNLFTGTIAVTVIDVLPNGNLVVSGEKQIGINQGAEFIRLSGIVNPTTILAGNVVSSTQVAEARLEYRGQGYLDEAQNPGLLTRLFMSVFPF